jgi:hypothetical protein
MLKLPCPAGIACSVRVPRLFDMGCSGVFQDRKERFCIQVGKAEQRRIATPYLQQC